MESGRGYAHGRGFKASALVPFDGFIEKLPRIFSIVPCIIRGNNSGEMQFENNDGQRYIFCILHWLKGQRVMLSRSRWNLYSLIMPRKQM